MTPIARELLAPSLENFGRSSTLPAEAYTAGSVFRWEQEHFFDRGWVCAGRAGGPEEAGDRRVVEWQGWLFANASGDAPTFEEHVGNLEELVRNYGCEELVVAARHDYQIAANWKILVENYHECYHCSSIHPELCEVSPPTSGGDNLEPEGAWIGGPMDLYEGVETMSLDGKSHAPNLPRLTEGQDRTVYYFQLFPNLLISLHPDYVLTHRLRPLAPDRTAVECEWLFSREAVETEGLRSFLRQRLLGHHQPPGLARLRGGTEGRLLARLPPRTPLAPRGRRLPTDHDGGQRLPRRWGRPPREPRAGVGRGFETRPYTINMTGFSRTRLTSAM